MMTYPLQAILYSPNMSGCLTKWVVELSEFDIEYRARTSLKSQVLVDFVAELTPDPPKTNDEPEEPWTLMVDGATNVKGSGVGVYLKSPHNEVIKQPFQLGFKASNNEAEYEALIAGLQLVKALGARRLKVHSDSQLIVSQVLGEYTVKDPRMESYLAIVQSLKAHFDECAIQQVTRNLNA